MKKEKQIVALRAFQEGKLVLHNLDTEPKVVGPSGEYLSFDYSSKYPKITYNIGRNGNPKKMNFYVHNLVVLWNRWLLLEKGQSLELAIYEEDMEVDHLNFKSTDNSQTNLKFVPRMVNQRRQRSKSRLTLLTDVQKKSIEDLLKSFPHADYRLLAQVLDISVNQI